MLALEGLRLRLGAFTLAADLTVERGARVAVLGPSGAGKSSLLSAVAGFLTPEAGQISWEGQDLGPMSPDRRPVSILFQDNNLFPHLTAAQNVGLGLKPSLRLNRAEAERVEEVLTAVGLADLGGRRPADLSGGQQSRVALARVLLRARPILLLDEPFAALGPGLRAEMLDVLARVAGETQATLLMVTHDPADARRLGGQTIFVDAGRAAPPVATDALFADPPPEVQRYLT